MLEILTKSVAWMLWSYYSAAFFGVIACVVVGMNLWNRRSPSISHQGFLPIPTTRGERVFLCCIVAFGIHLLWIALFGLSFLWGASIASAVVFVPMAKWG